MLFEKTNKSKIRYGLFLTFVALLLSTIFVFTQVRSVFPSDLASLEHDAWVNPAETSHLKVLAAYVAIFLLFATWTLTTLLTLLRGIPWQIDLAGENVQVSYVGFRSWKKLFPIYEIKKLEIKEGHTEGAFKLKAHLANYQSFFIASGREPELEILRILLEREREKTIDV